MFKFIVQMVDAYTKEVLETDDEVFDNRSDAEDYACRCSSDFAQGAEDFALSGDDDYISPEDVKFVVKKIKDKD
ncbi:MAG: hypothetical protein LUG52_00805 [Clostridia bacterium]|nr:hypothetical protein [Clostridia bacterium]